MSESTPFSRQRRPAPTEPLADRVAAVLAECDAARVRERARRDRVAAIEARPVPPAVTPELRAARARVRETREALDRALAAESESESEPARPPKKPSAARKPSAKPASKPARRRAIADSSDDDEAPAPAKPARRRRTIVESDSDDAAPAPPPRPATARPATISQDDAPRPAAGKPAAAGDAPPAMKKQSGYLHHNAQNRELARAMVESDPATAGLGAQERNQAVMKKLAAMWGELDAAQKQAFADDAPLVAVKPRKAKKGAAKPAARAKPRAPKPAAPRAETDEEMARRLQQEWASPPARATRRGSLSPEAAPPASPPASPPTRQSRACRSSTARASALICSW